MNLSNTLNNNAELWGMVVYENTETLEQDIKPGKIKNIYCNVLPQNSYIKNITEVNEVKEHTHKFRVRAKSIDNPKTDMYFILEGMKYEFIYWNVDFKNREFMDIFTKVVME